MAPSYNPAQHVTLASHSVPPLNASMCKVWNNLLLRVNSHFALHIQFKFECISIMIVNKQNRSMYIRTARQMCTSVALHCMTTASMTLVILHMYTLRLVRIPYTYTHLCVHVHAISHTRTHRCHICVRGMRAPRMCQLSVSGIDILGLP